MHNCPSCRSENVHRSRVRTTWEFWRKKITKTRPYRCHACHWRGWAPDLGSRFGDNDPELLARPKAADAPALKIVRGRRGTSDPNLRRFDARPASRA